MSVFVELSITVLRIALGLTTFSWAAWAFVTALLVVVGPVFAQAAPRIVDPPARLIATDPLRVAIWMPLSVMVALLATIALVVTIFGAVLVPILAIAMLVVGYLALARLVGDAVWARAGAHSCPPWVATLVGIAVLRLVRLVPIVGASLHSLLAWVGFAAATMVAIQSARRWYRRRLPDERQFRGELLVEWYPDGDPADGVPRVGSGRPVQENVRGDEDDDPAR